MINENDVIIDELPVLKLGDRVKILKPRYQRIRFTRTQTRYELISDYSEDIAGFFWETTGTVLSAGEEFVKALRCPYYYVRSDQGANDTFWAWRLEKIE